MNKNVTLFVVIIMMILFFVTCKDPCVETQYVDSSVCEDIDYTGYYNYARYKGSDEVVEIDACVKRLDKDTGLWMYDITVDNNKYSVEYYAIDLFCEPPASEWAWKD